MAEPQAATTQGDVPSPGLVDTFGLGRCDLPGVPVGADCHLGTQRRSKIAQFRERCIVAGANYQVAISQARVDALLAKDEDVSWVTSLVFGIASDRLTRLLGHVGQSFGAAARTTEAAVKPAVDATRVKTLAQQKAADNGERRTKSNETAALLDSLSSQITDAFESFRETIPATADDAQLEVLVDGMEGRNHTVAIYKAELEAKIARYHRSGVPKIGRNDEKRSASDPLTMMHGQDVTRDTRVVWITNQIAGQRRLYFEHQDARGHQLIDTKGSKPLTSAMAKGTEHWQEFGAFADEPLRLGDPVPNEFHETAIARHVAAWKQPPDELTVDRAGVLSRRPGVSAAAVTQAIHDIFIGGDLDIGGVRTEP